MVRSVVRGLVAGLLLAAAWTGAAPTRALAQDPPPEGPAATFGAPPPDHQPGSSAPVYGQTPEPLPNAMADGLPGFITMDRTDTASHAGIQVGFNKGDGVNLGDGFGLRFNPYGQVFMPNRIAAVYGQLALSHLSSGDGESGTGVGNLELGGLFLPYGDSRLILRGGLALPTASNDDAPSVIANFSTFNERLTDAVLILPEYTTLRLSASTIQQLDNFFLRVDAGFDLVISKPAASEGAATVLFRANVAGGVRTSVVDIAVELVNLAAVNGDNADGISERFAHTAAFSVRTRGENQFHFGPVFPLDEGPRGEVWILSLGYMRAFN